MATVEMIGKKRDLTTKGGLRTLRVQGEVPAVVYGGENKSFPLSVELKQFLKLLKQHGANVVMSLKLDGGTETVLVKEVQRDAISRMPIHIDFQRISLTETIEVSVPLHVSGEAPGVKLGGGILEHILREVRVKCLATNIPQSINVDVSNLQLNQGLRVKDLPVLPGVTVLTDVTQLIVNIVAPTELEEPATPAAGAAVPGAAEPEVIAKGKKPEEGAEGAAAAPAKGAEAKPAAGKPEAKPGK